MFLGFVLNDKKWSTVPEQPLHFFRFPDRFTNSESILTRRSTSLAQLLNLATKVASTNPVQTVRDLASLLDHCTQQGQKIAALRPTKNYNSPVNLGKEARSELG